MKNIFLTLTLFFCLLSYFVSFIHFFHKDPSMYRDTTLPNRQPAARHNRSNLTIGYDLRRLLMLMLLIIYVGWVSPIQTPTQIKSVKYKRLGSQVSKYLLCVFFILQQNKNVIVNSLSRVFKKNEKSKSVIETFYYKRKKTNCF